MEMLLTVVIIIVDFFSIIFMRKKYRRYNLKLAVEHVFIITCIIAGVIIAPSGFLSGLLISFLVSILSFFSVNQLIMGYTSIAYFHRYNILEIFLNFMFVCLCVAITQNIYFSAIFVETIYLLIGIISYLVLKNRGTQFEVGDIQAISTASTIAKKYSIKPDLIVICGIVVQAVQLMGICALYHIREIQISMSGFKRLSISFVLVLILAVLLFTPVLKMVKIQYAAIENCIGVWGNLLVQLAEMIHVGRKEKVDINKARQEIQTFSLVEKCDRPRKSDLPNVLVIMNESFSDLRCFEAGKNSELNKCYENIDELVKSGMKKGWVHTSVYGGNTAYSEFELLTGSSSRFYTSCPYSAQIIKANRTYDTFVTYMKDLGYRTIATHPYNRNNWRRPIVYSAFGFDEQYYDEELNCEETIRGYASDYSYYEKLIDIYRKKEANEKIFSFNITMQNHGGYSPNSGTVKENLSELGDVNMYMNLIRESDKAFAYLINFFKTYPEPTAILFFGDHQPKLCNEFYEKYMTTNGGGIEEWKKYVTPFYIWSNYEINAVEEKNMSINYLFEYFSSIIGLPGNAFGLYLENLSTTYPVITKGYILDSEMKKRCQEDDEKLLSYKNLAGYYMRGTKQDD